MPGPSAGDQGTLISFDTGIMRSLQRWNPRIRCGAAHPHHRCRQAVLVAPLGCQVEQLVGAVDRVEAARVARVGVVDDAVLEREYAQAGPLLTGIVVRPEVVFGASCPLLLRERDAEVDVEVAPDRGDPRDTRDSFGKDGCLCGRPD